MYWNTNRLIYGPFALWRAEAFRGSVTGLYLSRPVNYQTLTVPISPGLILTASECPEELCCTVYWHVLVRIWESFSAAKRALNYFTVAVLFCLSLDRTNVSSACWYIGWRMFEVQEKSTRMCIHENSTGLLWRQRPVLSASNLRRCKWDTFAFQKRKLYLNWSKNSWSTIPETFIYSPRAF